MIMETMIQDTPNETKRLYVNREDLPTNPTQLTILLYVLGIISIWGNYDVNHEDYLSWEFDATLPTDVINRVLLRSGLKVEV